jgi:filamentous hemagglutinin family protein
MVRWPSFYENKFFAGLIMKTISLPPRSALVHDPRRFPLRRRALLTSTALGAALLLWQPPAKAGPEGERIVAGQANVVRPNATTTLVTQASQSVLIDWRDFSIAANETVRFQQPNANALAINRVTGNQISNIFGSLQANGNVALINPAGVIIHNGATIDVGGLVGRAIRCLALNSLDMAVLVTGGLMIHLLRWVIVAVRAPSNYATVSHPVLKPCSSCSSTPSPVQLVFMWTNMRSSNCRNGILQTWELAYASGVCKTSRVHLSWQSHLRGDQMLLQQSQGAHLASWHPCGGISEDA